MIVIPRPITFRRIVNEVPRLWVIFAATVATSFIIHYNTIIHPFTLADNRHYVFYVFRILRSHWTIRYLVSPIYVVLAWLCIRSVATTKNDVISNGKAGSEVQTSLQSRQNMGLVLVWLVTTALSLITAPLVEPRYFIIPWALWRMSVPLSTLSHMSLCFETLWYGVINIVTGYMFLYRTFEWGHEPGQTQRFMW